MASLPEQSAWEPVVTQLETTDPVLGGPDGKSNEQAKQLGNRTRYLKDQVETKAPILSPALTGEPTAPTPDAADNTTKIANMAAVQAVVAAAVQGILNAPPGTLDTLNELAAALGDDPNFATTVFNLIAGKSDLGHGHALGDLAGVQAALDAKVTRGVWNQHWNHAGGYYTSVHGGANDFDAFTQPGLFFVDGNAANHPASGSYGFLEIFNHDNSRQFLQRFTLSGVAHRTFWRTSYDGGASAAWNPWKEMRHTLNDQDFARRSETNSFSNSAFFLGWTALQRNAAQQLTIGYDVGGTHDTYFDIYRGGTIRHSYVQALPDRLRINHDGGGTLDLLGAGDLRLNEFSVWHNGLVTISAQENGHEKLPHGRIRQWGRVNNVGNGSTAWVPFPTTFPNAVHNIQLTRITNGNNSGSLNSGGWNTGGFNIYNRPNHSDGSASANDYFFEAIGN